jgi:hypothetical protein
MRIPPNATIADDKLTAYLLVHRQWDDKSGYLLRAGFDMSNWRDLRSAILQTTGATDAVEDGGNEYGIFFRVDGLLAGPTGTLPVTLIWMRRAVDQVFHFVTLKPRKERG